jgi:hypothetical protein
MSNQSPAAHATWADLPDELRLQILEYKLRISDPLNSQTHPIRVTMTDLLALRLTSRHVNLMATEMWARNNYTLNYPVGQMRFPRPVLPFSKHIQRLHLNFTVPNHLSREPLRSQMYSNTWRLLLDLGDQDRGDTAWQTE